MVPGALVSTTTWIGSIDFATKVKYGPLKQFRLFWPFYYSCTLNSIFFFFYFSGETATCMYNSPHETESLARVLPGKLLTLDAQCRKDRGTSACFKVCIFARFPSSSSLKQKKLGFFELHWICTLWMRFDQILPIFKFKSTLCDLKTSKRVFFSKSTLIYLTIQDLKLAFRSKVLQMRK